jgi:hypothetical protein
MATVSCVGKDGLVVQFTQVTDTPVPVWVTVIDAKKYNLHPPVTAFHLLLSGLIEQMRAFRAVSIDRLPVILRTGIDVEPTTAPIYVAGFEKAWEYGGWPKVIMALDGKQLERTYREIPGDTPPDEIAQLMQDYPRRLDRKSGEYVWLTRLPESDLGAGYQYEREDARWVPGDPFDSLIAVFVFMPEDPSHFDHRPGTEGLHFLPPPGPADARSSAC